MTETIIRDRAFVEEKVMDIYKSLNASATKNSNRLNQPFTESKEIFMLAVSMGFSEGKRRPLEGKKEGLFFWNRLTPSLEIPALKIIALAETNDIKMIDNEANIQVIAEEYANAGIRIINEMILKKDGDPLWNLIDLIRKEI